MQDLSSRSACTACGKTLDAIARQEAVLLGGRCMLCASNGSKPEKVTVAVPPPPQPAPAELPAAHGLDLEAVETPTHWTKSPAASKPDGGRDTHATQNTQSTQSTPSTRLDRPGAPRPPKQCKHCGYDLAGLKSARCPECGGIIRFFTFRARFAEEELELSAHDERRRWFIAIALAIVGTGLHLCSRLNIYNWPGPLHFDEKLGQDFRHLAVGVSAGVASYVAAMLMSLGIVSYLPRVLTRLTCGYIAIHGVLVWLSTLRELACINVVLFPIIILGGYHFILTKLMGHDHLEAVIFIVPSTFILGIVWAAWYM